MKKSRICRSRSPMFYCRKSRFKPPALRAPGGSLGTACCSGSGMSPAPVRPRPKHRRQRAQHARHRADRARAEILRTDPRQRHRADHHPPAQRFHGGKHAPAELVRRVPQQLRIIQHRTHRHAHARQADEAQRQPVLPHLAERHVRGAVNDVRDRDGRLYPAKPMRRPITCPSQPPISSPTSGESPDRRRSPPRRDGIPARRKA